MYEGPVQNLIDEFSKLPGVGPKSAQRLAFHLLEAEPEVVGRLQGALQAISDGVEYCEVCGTVSAGPRCRLCSDPRRDTSKVCVVEAPKDIEAIERTREFDGLYHVLGGSLDPINGIGPGELRVAQLVRRIGEEVDGVEVAEVIIATNPNTTGEATTTYLVRLLRDFPGLTVSRLASGLPMGSDLEFADELTLGSALSGRRILSGQGQNQGQSQGQGQRPPALQRGGGAVLRPEQYDPAPAPRPAPEPEVADHHEHHHESEASDAVRVPAHHR